MGSNSKASAANSASANGRTRAIVKARKVAGSVVISLPAGVRKPLGIEAGDRVLVEVSQDDCFGANWLTVTKE